MLFIRKYDPSIHHRRSLRLKGYDYSRAGMYFITICCQNHEFRFGKIENKMMMLNQYGIIAQNEWYKLPERFKNLQLGAFQVMPNHIHAIILLNDPSAGATLAVAPITDHVDTVSPIHDDIIDAPVDNQRAGAIDEKQNGAGVDEKQFGAGASPTPAVSPSNPTVGNIVGAYKSLVANECLKIFISNNEKMGKLWQRNYYERIIRNHNSYQTITVYIMNNPAKWNEDKFYMQS